MPPEAQLLPGTLDVLISSRFPSGRCTATASFSVSNRSRRGARHRTRRALSRRWRASSARACLMLEWGTSDNNRRAKYYTLTTAGRRRLREGTASWEQLSTRWRWR